MASLEVDETYAGGKFDKRRGRGPFEKQAVFGAVHRGSGAEHSKVRAFPMPPNSMAILTGAVKGTDRIVPQSQREAFEPLLERIRVRFNHRKNEELFALTIINLLIASALPYAELTARSQASEPTVSDELF